jgi:hypothetical protein
MQAHLLRIPASVDDVASLWADRPVFPDDKVFLAAAAFSLN